MTFEYKCVAGPTIVAVKSAKARDHAVKAFEDIMNIEAAQGWEYVGIDEFHVSEPQGMFTRKRVYVPSKILVFRRVKAAVVPAMASVTPARVAVVPTALPAPLPLAPTPLAPHAPASETAGSPPSTVADQPTAANGAPADAQDTAPRSIRSIADKLRIARG
jgi:hypothetical protein